MEQQQYTINGVKVAFPCKAYPTQLSMMSMIIKGIEKRQNCLLESPTGSGKSLALLCSCLGWLKGEKDKRDRAEQENYQDIEGFPSPGSGDDLKKPCNCNCNNQTTKPATSPETVTTSSASNGPSTSTASLPSAPEMLQPPVAVVPQPENQDKVIPEGDVGKTDQDGSREDAKDEESKDGDDDDDDDDDDDFQPSKKRARPSSNHVTAGKKAKRQKGVVYEDEVDSSPGASRHPHTQAHWQMKLMTPQANAAATELSSRESTKEKSPCYCSCHLSKSNKLDKENKMKDNDAPPKKIPRIYFGTRTHKQIAQIIREMGRTSYKETRMTILASREHTCVHPEVSRSRNKNEGCKDLLDNNKGGSCKYYQNVHKMKQQWQIRDYGLTQAWDIEDLVDLGRRVKSCPYFASRNLREGADVVFCPYNYLIDPVIRESMEINLKGQIVVLDEAHNIEDSAREAASLKVTTEQLQETTDELDRLLTAQYRMEHTRVLHTVCSSILRWINDFSGTLRQNDFERASRVWSGQEMVAVLANMGITPATLSTLRHHLNGLTEEEDPDKKYKELGPKFTTTSASLINSLFIVFNFLFKEEYKYMMDYQVALLKTKAHNQHPNTNNRWLNRRRGRESTWTISLNFWCLNPAVAFSDFGSSVRTIILTSGTLSPMSSFASELGVKFPIQLEANHVIGKSQVWVSSLAIGPNGHSLNASYRNAETFAFQDDLGRVVTEVCKVTPYGVLCFLPSYSMMNKLMERWKATGAYYQLESMKSVMCEARGGDKTVFDEQLKEFYDIIKECEENGLENQTITGVLMFAVCRGKISEGMDFADNNARAVITVGIPFPNVRDSQVELKRKYNDQHSASRGLLTGSEWYEVQAYRALNQALGRCIRHKKDWGAILLVDDRFSRNPKKYISGLSKWVRGRVIHHTHARDALSSLSEFANSRMQGSSPPAEESILDISQAASQIGASTPGTSQIARSQSFHTPLKSIFDTPSSGMQERTRTSPPAGDASMSTPSKPWDPLRQQVRPNVGQLFLPASALAKTSSTPVPLGVRDVPMSRPSTLPAQGDGMRIVSTAPPQTVQIQNQQHLLGKPQESLVLPVVATKDAVLLPQVPDQQTIITPALQVPAGAGNLGVSTVLPQSPLGLQKSVASNGSTPQMVLHQKQITDCLMRKNGVLGQPYKGRDQAAVSLETVVGHHSDIPLSSTPQNTLPLKTVTSDIGKVIDLISPEKAEEADGEMLTSRIETPKTKLLFENGGGNEQLENSTAGKTPVQKKDSLASKLSVFAFAKRETGTRELHQSNQVKAGTDSRGKRNVRYAQHRYRYGQKAGSDLDSNENFAYEGITERTVPTSDDEEEEEERRKRMERRRENENGTPVLFDSEMGQLEDDLQGEELAQVCGRTDTTGCANADNVLPSNRQVHEEKEDADEEECEETLANRNFHRQKSDDSNLKPAGRNTRLSSRGRRSLARRKDDASWQPEPPENGEGSAKGNRAKLSVRRSSRTSRRVGRNETTEENDKNADGMECCDIGVRCLQCDAILISHTQAMSGVTALSAEAVGRRYIQHQLTRLDGGDSASEPQHRDPCGCQRAGTVDRSEMVLVVATDAIHGCQSIGCDLGSDNMLQLNAHWSEEDSCCYCPITCAVCAGTTGLTAGDSRRRAVIGYSVMVAGDSSSGPEARNTYLPVRRLRCCDALLASTVAVKA